MFSGSSAGKIKFSEEKLDADLEELLPKVRRDVKVASRSVPADYNRDGTEYF